MAGHLAMNHAVIAWLRSNAHEVTVLLVRPRLHAVIERYDHTAVEGIGISHWRNHIFVGNLRGALGILGRGLLGKLPARAASLLRRRLRTQRYGLVDTVLGAFITPEQSAWCAARVAKLAPDAILVDTIFRAPCLRLPALAQVQRVIFAQDLFYLRHRVLRGAGYQVYPAELTQATEAGLLNLANAIAAIQSEEATAFREMCPDRSVCIVAMPAIPCPRPEKTKRIPGRLVFVGSSALPNLDGLRWLFAEIWPRLQKLHPTVSLDLVGDCGGAFPLLPPGVARRGRVDELSPILHRSALAIAPLRVGSGLKIKILDYARHGLVTVATAEGLAGFAPDENAPFVTAADAPGFAAAVVARLQADDAIGERNALAYVTRHYNVTSSFAGLATVLNLPEGAKATSETTF